MTPKEVLEHDWKIGELLWEVCFTYDRTLWSSKPLSVVEVEVIGINRVDTCKSDYEYVELELRGNFNNLSVDPGDLDYKNTKMCAMVDHVPYFGDSYHHHQFCTHKYFKKADAVERFKKEVAKWNKRAKTYRTNQLNKLDDLMKKVEEQQKLVNSIDLDELIIK